MTRLIFSAVAAMLLAFAQDSIAQSAETSFSGSWSYTDGSQVYTFGGAFFVDTASMTAPLSMLKGFDNSTAPTTEFAPLDPSGTLIFATPTLDSVDFNVYAFQVFSPPLGETGIVNLEFNPVTGAIYSGFFAPSNDPAGIANLILPTAPLNVLTPAVPEPSSAWMLLFGLTLVTVLPALRNHGKGHINRLRNV